MHRIRQKPRPARAYFLKAWPSLFLRLEGKFGPPKLEKLVLTRLETGSMAKIHRLGLVRARFKKLRLSSGSKNMGSFHL